MGWSFLLAVVIAIIVAAAATGHPAAAGVPPRVVAAAVAFSPLALGAILQAVGRDSLPALWPFHKDARDKVPLLLARRPS